MFHALEKFFQPLDTHEASDRKEVLYQKNLETGDCTCYTRQVLIGWVIYTVRMTLFLPLHRYSILREILSTITLTIKRIDMDKWHWVLGELIHMEIALPRYRRLFSNI